MLNVFSYFCSEFLLHILSNALGKIVRNWLFDMFGLPGLLGKRSPSSHPTGSPLPSGTLPGGGDVPAAPASKLAAKPDLEERFERLLESFVELKAQGAVQPQHVVPDLQLQITKLAQQVGEERAAKKDLGMELDVANKSRSETVTLRDALCAVGKEGLGG